MRQETGNTTVVRLLKSFGAVIFTWRVVSVNTVTQWRASFILNLTHREADLFLVRLLRYVRSTFIHLNDACASFLLCCSSKIKQMKTRFVFYCLPVTAAASQAEYHTLRIALSVAKFWSQRELTRNVVHTKFLSVVLSDITRSPRVTWYIQTA